MQESRKETGTQECGEKRMLSSFIILCICEPERALSVNQVPKIDWDSLYPICGIHLGRDPQR